MNEQSAQAPHWRIGIDLGGTKIEGCVLDPQGQLVTRQRIASPQGSYAGTLSAISDLVEQLSAKIPPVEQARRTIGIGTPGAWVPGRRIMKNCNSTWLNGRPLLDDLRRRLPVPVAMANDANCFALSEAVDGAAAGADSVFGVILGTGVGGGVVVSGSVLAGANAIAGEWGHNRLNCLGVSGADLPGPRRPCYCGRYDCVETWLSGAGLVKSYQWAGDIASSSSDLTAQDIVARADAGEDCANSVLRSYARQLAAALANVINVLDPDVIVLGGGLSNIQQLYDYVPQYWVTQVFSEDIQTRLVPPVHGDSSGVRGAAWLPAGALDRLN